jgi:O-antigen/teichoic acid export membrane protein
MYKKIKEAQRKYAGELWYTASRYFHPFVGLVTSAIAATFIVPQDMGLLQSLMLIAPYFSFLQLGVINGLNRNIAFYKAQGEHVKVQSMVNTSFVVCLVISVFGFLVGLSVLGYALAQKMPVPVVWGGGVLMVTLTFTPLALHCDTTYRSGQEFRSLGIIGFIEDGIGILTGLLPIILGYAGKALSDMARAIVLFVLRWRSQPIPASFDFSFRDYRTLVKIGFPLMVGGYFLELFNVADQTLIALKLGAEPLGHYTLSRLLLMAIVILPASLSVLLYPRASAAYGRTKSNRGLRRFFWIALCLNIAVLVPVCIGLFFLIEPVTLWVLPRYAPGISAAKINILTCLTLVSNGPSIIEGVVKRPYPTLIATIVALGGMWGVGFWLLNNGSGIETVAWLRFFFALMLGIFKLGYSYWLTMQETYRE